MKDKAKKSKGNKALRQQILQSMLASFKIEGINIPTDLALATLRKVELNLEK